MAQALNINDACRREFERRCQLTIRVVNDGRGLKIEYESEDNRRWLAYLAGISRNQAEILCELYCDNRVRLRHRVREFYDLRNSKLVGGPSADLVIQKSGVESSLLQRFSPADVPDIQAIHRSAVIRRGLHDLILPTSDLDRAAEFLAEVYRDILTQLRQRPIFQQYFWKRDFRFDSLTNFLPTIRGWSESLSAILEQYVSLLRPKILILSQPRHTGTSAVPSQLLDPNSSNPWNVSILLAPSGSGKTKVLSDLLSQVMGIYLLAGNVDPRTPSSPHVPRRSDEDGRIHGSKDTWNLRQMLDYEMSPWELEALRRDDTANALPLSLIRSARSILSQLFSSVHADAQTSDNELAPRWFRFQTNCADMDAFDDVFRLLTTMPDDAVDHSPNIPNSIAQHLCIDEAQADLEVHVSQIGRTVNLLKGMLNSWSNDVLTLAGTSLDYDMVVNTTVASEGNTLFNFGPIGSSKPIVNDISNLDTTKQGESPFYLNFGMIGLPGRVVTIVSALPQVLQLADFDDLLQHRNPGLYSWLRSNCQIENSVKRESSRLHGRYRWCAVFIDLLDIQRTSKGLNDASVIEIAQKAFDQAKMGLVLQLKKIAAKQDPSSHRLINDILPTAAIWCNILDQPYVFGCAEDITLVEHGFTSVTRVGKSKVKARLDEKVAVDALIDGLTQIDSDLIEKKLVQMLNLLQDDASGFGTKAERLLVYELRKYLQLRGANMLSGFDDGRRQRIMAKFGHATNIQGQTLGNTIDPLDLFLLHGDKVSHKRATGSASTIEPWDWLNSIRHGQMPRYSFLLMDESVGPDLMFVLRPQSKTQSCVLCFMQLKTGATRLSGKGLTKALNTTAPHTFFPGFKPQNPPAPAPAIAMATATIPHVQSMTTSAPPDVSTLEGRKRALEQELAMPFWTAAKQLSVLFTAAQPAQSSTPSGLSNEYFIWIDEKHTAAVFGPDFARLLGEVKNRPIPT